MGNGGGYPFCLLSLTHLVTKILSPLRLVRPRGGDYLAVRNKYLTL